MAQLKSSAAIPFASCYNSGPQSRPSQPKHIGASVMKGSSCRGFFRAVAVSWHCCALLALLSVPAEDHTLAQISPSPGPQLAAAQEQQFAWLEPGKPIARTLSGVELHRYQLKLQKGQC